SVGAAADGRFLELPVDLFGDGAGFLVKRGHAGGPLHGHAIDAAFEAKGAVFVDGLQRAEFSVEAGGLFGLLDANVDFGGGFGRDYVGAGSAADDAGIHRDSALQIVELREGGNLPRQFLDGTV